MGFFTEYLDNPDIAANFQNLIAERKKQLKRIADLRGRDVLAFVSDLNKGTLPGAHQVAMGYHDLLPITDQLANLTGDKLDLIIETPGGLGEVAEEIMRICRSKYTDIAAIVPGWAKSAGTIMVMGTDEILMGPCSALGPIDAQLSWAGKQFSADAFLEGMEKIKKEVVDTGILNKAYIPILQAISPGELQSAQDALDFGKALVTDWLAQYKFKNWTVHSSSGQGVTYEDRRARAKEVADQLCDHRHWLTHGRSIRIQDLQQMRLQITDYSTQPDLADAIGRYFALVQMTFFSNIYKVYETVGSQIMKGLAVPVPPPAQLQQMMGPPPHLTIHFRCNRCGAATPIQANFEPHQPLPPGHVPFPRDNKFKCPRCGIEHDLTDTRRQIEAQTKRNVIS
jgi:ClpP class serine protease